MRKANVSGKMLQQFGSKNYVSVTCVNFFQYILTVKTLKTQIQKTLSLKEKVFWRG